MKSSNNTTNKVTFSADGIRGISEVWPFTKEGIYLIGQALCTFLSKKNFVRPTVVLGRDTRPSGIEYISILLNCFEENRISVIDLGIVPTPVVGYITHKRSAQLGVVVSGSHTSIKYNGIKLFDSQGLRLQTSDERLLETIINSFDTDNLKGTSHAKEYFEPDSENFIDEYIQDQIDILFPGSLKNDLRLLIDCSNGAIARTGKKLLSRLGAKVISVNDGLSGQRIINDQCGSEYVRKHPLEFIKLVRENDAEYGFAFDGDGDRVVVVDKEGNFYNGDDLVYVLARYHLQKGILPGNVIFSTEMANSGLKTSLQKDLIQVIETKNGDKYLEAVMWNRGQRLESFENYKQLSAWLLVKMKSLFSHSAKSPMLEAKQKGYRLGAEQVGNIIINDGKHGSADSLYSIALLLTWLNYEESSLEEKTEFLRKQPQVLATVFLTEIVSQDKIDNVIREMKENLCPDIRVKYWYSSTEPGLFNVMMEWAISGEGVESDNVRTISELAYLFCQKVSSLCRTQSGTIDVMDLSSRRRVGEVAL